MKEIEYSGELLGEIRKNDRASIRAYIREYKGHKFVEMREWVTSTDYNGPDKRGITFPPDLAAEVVDVLSKAMDK